MRGCGERKCLCELVKKAAEAEGASIMVIGAAIEADIAELETHEERAMFLEDLGLEEAGVAKLIRQAYALLDLQTYFTAGEKEVRAWTFRRGYTAPQAAGSSHRFSRVHPCGSHEIR